jgi:hypothetical protein
MGGAIFQNGGTLTLNGVTLTGSTARGGSPDLSGMVTGGGFGANGTGGDLGGVTGPGDGAGGILDSAGGPGGFGAGGGQGTANDGSSFQIWGGIGGFGGSYGREAYVFNASLNGPTPNGQEGIGGGWGAGEGGAGFGGAIFVRSGMLNLNNVTFSNNSAIGGTGAQGKGGALFLFKGAVVNQTSGLVFSNNTAAQAGVGGQMYTDNETYFPGSLCPGVDTTDVCGAFSGGNQLSVTVTGNGSVTDSNGLINCGAQCTALYQGSTTLLPVPGPGGVFQNWSGACTGSGSCVVSLAGGPATVNATFIPATQPTVTQDPQPVTVTAPATAVFTAAANGNPAPTVRWQVSTDGGANFTDIPGATATTLSFATQASMNGNRYRAVFTNTGGFANSAGALLTVQFPPNVTQDPGAATVTAGTQAIFTAAASGNPAPTVKWQVSTDGGTNFTDVPGANTATLTFSAQGSQNGNRYRAVFTNIAGPATSASALLTVNKANPVLTWPAPSPIAFGGALGSAQLRATANIPGSFVYTPPAGTVLPAGNHQLSVTFTPTDTANYNTATQSVPLTVTASGATAVRIVVTSVLRRDPSTNEVIATLTLANTGSTAAANVVITRAAIGATTATTAVPLTVGTIGGGSTTQVLVQFSTNAGASGALRALSVSGSFTGGTFSSGSRIVLP